MIDSAPHLYGLQKGSKQNITTVKVEDSA